MDEEAYNAIISEWSGGGLARCLAGEEPPVYPMPHPSRIVEWRDREVRILWNAAEDAIMRDLYRTWGYRGLLDLLPRRSRDAIKSRARTLGLQIKRPGPRVRDLWAAREARV